MLRITNNAARRLRALLEEKAASPGTGLRLLVEHGGCAGMQYGMKLDRPAEGDSVTEHDGVIFIVDPESAVYLRGSQVDYVESLNDSGFKIFNPNAARSCGCGTSFEPAPATRDEAGGAAPD